MDNRTKLYVSGIVAGLASYVFNSVAFTGSLNFLRTGVFVVFFTAVMFGFEKFMNRAEKLEQ